MTLAHVKNSAARGGPERRAAPPGGDRKRWWSCHLTLTILMATTAMAQGATTSPVALNVPSGQPVYLLEFLDEPDAPKHMFRARFVAPDLDVVSSDIESVFADMELLCNTVALPEIGARAIAPDRIIVSISSAPMELGTIAPEITQFFESYSIADDTCIWELF